MPEFGSIARWFMILGLVFFALGGLIWILARSGLPLGKLPGDLKIESGGFTCLVPLASAVLLSLLLTILLNLILRMLHK